MSEIKYEIEKKIGIISSFSNKTFEFNIVKWNGNRGKYDVRKWDDTNPQKGITFSYNELLIVYELLKKDRIDPKNNLVPIHLYKTDDSEAKIYRLVGEYKTLPNGNMTGQITYTSWGGRAKYDFRNWNSDYSICSKGITMSDNEVDVFINLIELELNKSSNEEYDTSEIDDLLIK